MRFSDSSPAWVAETQPWTKFVIWFPVVLSDALQASAASYLVLLPAASHPRAPVSPPYLSRGPATREHVSDMASLDPPSTLKPTQVAVAMIEHGVAKHRTRADVVFFKSVRALPPTMEARWLLDAETFRI